MLKKNGAQKRVITRIHKQNSQVGQRLETWKVVSWTHKCHSVLLVYVDGSILRTFTEISNHFG